MELRQSEIEKAHDAILEYLKTKGSVSAEVILNGINKYYKDRRKIIAELKSKDLIKEHVIEHEEKHGYGFGNDREPYTRREYTYSISPEGREFIRKGGFRKKWWMNMLSNWERVVILLLLAVSTFFGIPYFSTERDATSENNTGQQEEKSLSKPDTLESDSAQLKIDTNP